MNKYNRYYFLGIGGIGMRALARYFHTKGYEVIGYDRTPTKLTAELQAEGIAVNFNENVDQIPPKFTQSASTLVVMTPAIPQNHPQLIYFQDNNFTIQKRAQVLGNITRQNKGICIAGTHGKTTTSTIAAHLLYQSQVSCNAFLGGIANNYNTNLLLSNESNLVVIEADEYDRSFHQLSPYMAVITSADPDHLDIYDNADAFRESFEHFTSLIRTGGVLIMRKGIDIQPRLQKGVKLFTYSMEDGGDFHAENIRTVKGDIHFDFVTPNDRICDLRLGVPAKINVENSVAAMALAWLNGVTAEELRTGISSFSGIYRRFNLVYKTKKIVSCVYWIGVGKEASEAWKKNVSIFKNLASGAATILGGGPLAGFAIGTVASFIMPSIGEDVAYWLIPDYKNSQLFLAGKTFMQFDKGKGIAAYGKNTRFTQGSFYIGLLNDNKFQDIDANVKISVIWEISTYEDKLSIEKKITPRFEKKTFSEPTIITDTIPILCY